MQRLTAQRVNGIKTGYWSAAKKDELIQRLGELEDAAERSERRGTQASGWIDPAEQLPEVFQQALRQMPASKRHRGALAQEPAHDGLAYAPRPSGHQGGFSV